MGQVEVRGGLEGMGEGVPEVEVPARAVVMRIAETESGLEGGCAASVERGAREELRLDELGLPLSPLAVRQRLEQRLVEHDTRGPVEGPDEVLALRDVDRRLAADAGVDLADERRRHGDPRDAAKVERRRKPGGIRE